MQRESGKIPGQIMEFHFGKWLETLAVPLLMIPACCEHYLVFSGYSLLELAFQASTHKGTTAGIKIFRL